MKNAWNYKFYCYCKCWSYSLEISAEILGRRLPAHQVRLQDADARRQNALRFPGGCGAERDSPAQRCPQEACFVYEPHRAYRKSPGDPLWVRGWGFVDGDPSYPLWVRWWGFIDGDPSYPLKMGDGFIDGIHPIRYGWEDGGL